MTRNIAEIQTVLTPVFHDYGISRAVLFGSVAKGTATEKSDLDLLVDSKLRGLKFVGFMEAVCQAVGMPVNILDVSHIEKDSNYDSFIADMKLVEACVFNLSQLGELCRAVDASFAAAHPDIPWREMYGLRNRIVYDYEGVNLRLVWEIISEDIPELRDKTEFLFEEE